MLKSFPFASLGITAGVMAADGLLASRDIDNRAKTASATNPVAPGSSPPVLKSDAFKLQAASLVAGVIGEVAGWHPDYTEPLMLSGAGLMARAGALHYAQSKATPSATVQGYRAHVAAPAQYPAMAAAYAAQTVIAPADQKKASTQPVTIAG